ncbi:hypothetical protein BH11MYX1_BH11MYX1_46200 [soil metagenome]
MFSPPRNPRVVLFAFSKGGTPHRGVQLVTRAQDPAWFDAWRQGSLRTIAEQDLGTNLEELDACDTVNVIASEPRGVTDLAYLEDAWALARELGPRVVLDAIAMRYLASPPVQVEIANEFRLVFETDALNSDRAHALHTRGMLKFGAPDLVALCTDADAPLVGQAMRELAEDVARGSELATPRHALEVAPGVRWVVVPDEQGVGALLQLGNEARVIVDEHGKHLVSLGAFGSG